MKHVSYLLGKGLFQLIGCMSTYIIHSSTSLNRVCSCISNPLTACFMERSKVIIGYGKGKCLLLTRLQQTSFAKSLQLNCRLFYAAFRCCNIQLYSLLASHAARIDNGYLCRKALARRFYLQVTLAECGIAQTITKGV